MAEAAANARNNDDDDDDDGDSGPDPVEAKKRFTALKRQHNKTEKVIAAKGRDSAEAQKEMEKLGELFKFFKLTPRVFDPLTDTARNILAGVRDQEREIMRLAVRVCGMPRKDFITSFQGSESDLKWVSKHTRGKKDHATKLAGHKDEIQRLQRRIAHFEEQTGLSVGEI